MAAEAGCNQVMLKPCLLQPEQSQFSQPFLTEEVLHPSNHLDGPFMFLLLGKITYLTTEKIVASK